MVQLDHQTGPSHICDDATHSETNLGRLDAKDVETLISS
jgi:hypothetical protein